MAVDQTDFVMILAGDHIYKMNYFRMLKQHIDTQADVTLGVIEVPIEEAHRFGIIQFDSSGKLSDFLEKPKCLDAASKYPSKTHASMGIYIFNKLLLAEVLEADSRDAGSSHDFGKDIIPKMILRHDVCAHHFTGEDKGQSQYWMDVGTIDAYYEANMDLVDVTPQFNLYDKVWPIRTYQRQYPPAKFVFAQKDHRMGIALDSIVCGGCIVSGGRIMRSILSPDVRINSYCDVRDSIIFAHVDIGRYSKVSNAIIDRGVRLPERTSIGFDAEQDRKRYHVTENGLVVVSPAHGSPGD
jgi:glucose-1-phosphate adenylyltransferase